jgi:nitrite reductase/ring-hydroxylating ferredoxin subunit
MTVETEVTSMKDLLPGQMIGVEKDGKSILVANINGAYYAIGNICTHAGCTISDGMLKGERVQCPCHGSTFDLRTGAVVKGPARSPEPSYILRVDGDKILADL